MNYLILILLLLLLFIRRHLLSPVSVICSLQRLIELTKQRVVVVLGADGHGSADIRMDKSYQTNPDNYVLNSTYTIHFEAVY